MSEGRTTLAWTVAALMMALIAWATAPRVTVPEMFSDRGELFFPQFTDPNEALSLEIIEYNAAHGVAQAVKIANRDGRWTIPSQFNYPVDARSRVGAVAAAIMTARKDDVASQEPGQHRRFGVLDPADPAVAEVTGKGTRISIRGQNDRVLADLIVGGAPDGQDGYRYVRLPFQSRVYLSRLGAFEVSSAFEDWIDRDVLLVKADDIDEIVIRNYSVDEQSGAVKPRETTMLRREAAARWRLHDGAGAVPVPEARIADLLARLVAVRIVGVLPKPAGIAAMLNRTAPQQKVADEDLRDLARKGFYVASGGELLSNEGEVIVHTRAGIFYTLRFGQVAKGVDLPPSGQDEARAGEHRYLFVMAAYDPSSITSGAAPSDDAAQRIRLLHARFAPWYYIISADDFSKLRPGRAALVNQ